MFASNAIRHVALIGKTISSAVCGHILIDAALITIIVAKAYRIPLPTKDTDDHKRDTSSTDSEICDEEIRSTGQKQVTDDVTPGRTEAT